MKNTDFEKYPYRLRPILCDKIWGGERLEARYGKQADVPPLGESWELTVRPEGKSVIDNGALEGTDLCSLLGCTLHPDGSDFPLLVKFIDAGDRLSVQVHPHKTELWYVVEADEGAELIYGLAENSDLVLPDGSFDGESFRRCVESEEKMSPHLHRIKVRPGEFYLLPSGLVHGIGEGILVAEIQQNSNVTSHLYDYGRGRELQIDDAINAISSRRVYRIGDGGAVPGVSECGCFGVEKHELSRGESAEFLSGETFLHLLCVAGEGEINWRGADGKTVKEPVKTGESRFLPEGCPTAAVTTDGEMTLLASRAK